MNEVNVQELQDRIQDEQIQALLADLDTFSNNRIDVLESIINQSEHDSLVTDVLCKKVQKHLDAI